MRPALLPAAFAFACALLAGSPARAIDTKLPDMGSSAGAIASPEEQRQYGFYVLHELRNQGMVLDDALLKTLSEGQNAIFVVFKTPEEGVGIPVSLNGFGDGFKELP